MSERIQTEKYQLILGDCLKEMSVLVDQSVDMILTDLPYGTTRNSWDTMINLDILWKEFLRVLKENGCIALWAQEPFTTQLIMSQPALFRYKWIVEKTNATGFLNARRMPLKCYEELLIFYRKLPTYNPQMTSGHPRKTSTAFHRRNCKTSSNYNELTYNSYDSTDRFPRDIVTFAWDKQKSAIHPTQKPVRALEYFIQTYTMPEDIVLDAAMGSGSTGIACLNTDRYFIGIEKNDHYYDAAKQRIETHADTI